MEYTPINYEEDLKISHFVFNKYFARYKHLKDDMIQSSLMKLWQCRPKFDENKSSYGNFAIMASYHSMLIFLRKENKHFSDCSLYEEADNHDCCLLDLLCDESETDLDFLSLKNMIADILAPYEAKRKKVIELFLAKFTYAEIAKHLHISKPYVSKIVNNFRDELRAELDMPKTERKRI